MRVGAIGEPISAVARSLQKRCAATSFPPIVRGSEGGVTSSMLASGSIPTTQLPGRPVREYRDPMAVLSDEEVDTALSELKNWERVDNSLRRVVEFPSFLGGIEGVRRVAERAEAADHHPDIDIRWRKVTFVLSTHSEGGITKKDLGLAKEIDEIVGQ
jgi:4a-hydroxytetrahydrobiopterin dehydratase